MKKEKKENKNLKNKGGEGNKNVIKFPANLLIPIGRFLQNRLKLLEKRKKDIEKADPFKDVTRLEENASPDSDAAEQFGHASSSALKGHMDKTIVQTRKALTMIKIGKYGICEDCGDMIDTDRLIIYPEATLCAKCQSKREK